MFRILKKLFSVVFILVVGGIGGVVAERTLVPLLASREPFSRIPRLTVERTTIVQPKEEVIIDRSEGLERAVASVRPTLVSVQRRNLHGDVLDSFTGVALTADGMVVTDAAIVGSSGTFTIRRNGETFDASFVAKDTSGSAAIFRAERLSVPIVPFAEDRDLVLGKTLFLLWIDPQTYNVRITTGLVSGGVPEISIATDSRMAGAPLFTFEGKLVGIVGRNGDLLPISHIRALLERSEGR